MSWYLHTYKQTNIKIIQLLFLKHLSHALVSVLSDGNTVETTTWGLPSWESHSRGACVPAVTVEGDKCHRRG